MITVLIVDDQAMVRSGLRLILEAEDDINVIAEAENGVEGVRLARREKPDVVLMDVRMPVMDGLEATRKLRAIPEFLNIPIIALTATAGEDSKLETLNAGCTDYLSKPVQISELLEILDRYL